MMFGIDSLYIWLAVIIISVAVEAFTLTLCGIWFAAGGVAALIAASLSVGLMGQWIVFIVFSALLPEALPSIVRGVAVTLIAVLGYTAIAGAVGAGGLGDIAIRYGYYRYESELMIITVILLVIVVQLIQSVCDLIARRVDHR